MPEKSPRASVRGKANELREKHFGCKKDHNEKKRAAIGDARLIVEEHLLELRAAQAARRYLLQLGALPPSLAALRKTDPSAFLAEVSERIGEKR